MSPMTRTRWGSLSCEAAGDLQNSWSSTYNENTHSVLQGWLRKPVATSLRAASCKSGGHQYLNHEVFTEAPAWLCSLLPQGPHVILKLAEVFGERHEQQCPEFGQEGIPGFLSSRRVLQRVRQHNTPAKT